MRRKKLAKRNPAKGLGEVLRSLPGSGSALSMQIDQARDERLLRGNVNRPRPRFYSRLTVQ